MSWVYNKDTKTISKLWLRPDITAGLLWPKLIFCYSIFIIILFARFELVNLLEPVYTV